MLEFRQWFEAYQVPKSHITIKLPSTKQTTNYSCGPVSLKAIARYFKVGPDDEQYYIRLCNANSKDGTTPNNLTQAAKKLGLYVKLKQNMTLDELKEYLDRKVPVICDIQAWGNKKDFADDKDGHYVVAIGYSNSHIYFMDPSVKGSHGYLSNAEFLSRWHDEEKGGKKTHRLGIAIWKDTPEKEKQQLHKVKKIK